MREFFGDFVIYRNLVPADRRLAAGNELSLELGLTGGPPPRKAENEYGLIVAEMLRQARKLDFPKTMVKRLVYIGDTHMNDGTAFRNICLAGSWPGWAFIGQEDMSMPRHVVYDEPFVLANRWSALSEFLSFLDEKGFVRDEETVVVIDVDKTAIGAKGRNDGVIDDVRVESAKRTVADVLGVGAEAPAAYRGTLLLSALLLCVAFLPLLRVKAQSHTTASVQDPIPPAQRTQWATLWRLFIPQIVIGIGAGALVPFLNVFLKSRFGLSDSVLGLLFAIQAIAMGVATLLGPALAAKVGRIRALVLTQVASIPFLALLGFSPVFPIAACAFFARAGLMNMGSPLYSAFSMEQVDVQHRATASALLVMSSQGSRAASSWISGLLQEGPGFAPVFALTIACYVVASFLVLRFFGRRPLDPVTES